jgi:putative nucleotidyltransferase with HDIG domain
MIQHFSPRLVSRTSAALFGLVIAAATLALVVPLVRFEGGVNQGDIASRTLRASHKATFQSEALTNAARDDQAALAPEEPLPVDAAVVAQQKDRAARYLDQVRAIVARSDLSAQGRQDAIAAIATPQPMTNFERAALQSLTAAELQSVSTRASSGLDELLGGAIRKDQIETQVRDYVDRQLPAGADGGGGSLSDQRTALSAVMRVFAVETFKPDSAATEKKREDARNSVAPVFRSFSAGQVIVTEGQEITDQDIEALKSTGVIDDGLDFYAIGGGALLSLGFGLLLAAYVYIFQPFKAPARRRMVLVAVTVALTLLAVRIIFPLVTPDTEGHYYVFALPVATAAIITASFADISLAALVAVTTGLVAAFVGATAPQIAGASYVGSLQSLELGMTFAAGGLAGAAAVHRATRLGQFAIAGVAVALATGAVMAVFWLVSAQRANIDLAWIGGAAAAHGLLAAILSAGLFVVLSLLLGVTTRIQLMELAQADHPLLRRLQDEAPGTYHHSMLVGALAERAAAQIGADPLLVRVGAYYHDIGKLSQPADYVENTQEGQVSPHDALPPVESARIIKAHVSYGLELARKYRLPGMVRDFIPEHHGTRLVTFFYRKASEKGGSVDPTPYRYEGPRPQTRESAIVMLADSSEAVSRAREEEGAAALDRIVDAVFAERLAEGQLDDCDITLRELQTVAASFKATLRAVYHPRVRYPAATAEEIATLARGETPVATR